MVDKVYYPQPIIPAGSAKDGKKIQQTQQLGQTGFKEILENQISSGVIKFSAHAQQRLDSRNIQLTPADIAKIGNAVDRAAMKGSKDSLVLMNKLALVVSVTNKTVVTAVDEASMKEHVFTNIDSAVFV